MILATDPPSGKRSGILAQAAPNIGPVFFDEILGKDDRTRSIQWTARVEPSLGEESLRKSQSPHAALRLKTYTIAESITMSQYLGRGAVSRGRMTLTTALNTAVSVNPYLNNDEDVEAVIKALDNLRDALSDVEGLVWTQPPPDVSSRQYVDDVSANQDSFLEVTEADIHVDDRVMEQPPRQPLDRYQQARQGRRSHGRHLRRRLEHQGLRH